MTPVIDLDHLDAGYGAVSVVTGMCLHVDAGEVVALLGPNGAGKTTTLLTISGLLPPLGGTARLHGTHIDHRAPERNVGRGLAHVPEDRSLFPGLTVAEHLRLARARDGQPASEVLELFPALLPLRDRRAGLLSGGEQQMLALARALVSTPSALIVDEMSLGLAPLIADHLVSVLRELATERGIAVLLVEQHIELALGVSDRGYVLSNGTIVAEGAAAALREDRHLLEASYLGAGET